MTLTSRLGLDFSRSQPAIKPKAREQKLRRFVPYTMHYDESTLLTEDDRLVQIIQLDGLAFQTQDEDTLRRQKRFRNRLLRSVAKSDLGVMVHVIRRKDFAFPTSTFPNRFCWPPRSSMRRSCSIRTW